MKIQIDRSTVEQAIAALEVAERNNPDPILCTHYGMALANLRAALTAAPAEPDDVLYRIDDNGVMHIAEPTYKEYLSDAEPVAWVFKPHNELLWPQEVEAKNPIELDSFTPLYAAPQTVADTLDRIAHEPPINGNHLAQARVLMAAASARKAAPQPQREPLKPSEIDAIYEAIPEYAQDGGWVITFARAIEKAHGIFKESK